MAPDKIWVTTSEMTVLLSERRHDYDVAYIRKDALLEWAKAYREEADASARGRTDNPSWGESVAIRALINKINSL